MIVRTASRAPSGMFLETASVRRHASPQLSGAQREMTETMEAEAVGWGMGRRVAGQTMEG